MEMQRNERVESGEKLFVIGMVICFVTEVAYPTANLIESFLDGFLLGVVGSLVVLRLANWLYTGNSTAYILVLGWAGLQIIVALGVLVMISTGFGRESPSHLLGYGISWVPYGKLAAYVITAA